MAAQLNNMIWITLNKVSQEICPENRLSVTDQKMVAQRDNVITPCQVHLM
jgi:hypothetical protein